MYQFAPGLRLVLASASPRRKKLLGWLGFEFDIRPMDVDEAIPEGETAMQAARRLAKAKAHAAAHGEDGEVILAADTLVTINDRILGKPNDVAEAKEMLAYLAGREHQVVTGFHLIGPGLDQTGSAQSQVRFRPLTQAEIDAYVATGEPMDKAGSYAIQGMGACIVEEVSGSYTNVVGLPLAAVVKLMLEQDVIVPA